MPETEPSADAKTYAAATAEWQRRRLARLTADEGWLTVVGRIWLDDAANVGADPESELVLPAGSPQTATAVPDEGLIRFRPATGGELILRPGKPFVPWERFLLEATQLDGRLALRIRDREASARLQFEGLKSFPLDLAWRIVAEWLPVDPPVERIVDTIAGVPTRTAINRKAAFTIDGRRHELLPAEGLPDRPMFVFRDHTSGTETYGAARFLYGEQITEDHITLDFNRAINPPCAFTIHAVCPLPFAENILPFRIPAGELAPHP